MIRGMNRTVEEAFKPPEAVSTVRKRNRLPLMEYKGAKAYSLTLATAQRQPWFADETITEHCLGVLKDTAEAYQFEVYAFCFMPDHLHLLVGSEEHDLIDFVKRFKQKTGWWFSNRYFGAGGLQASPTGSSGLWQRSYYDHVVRSDENLRAAAEYILANPVQAGLSDEAGKYRFAGSLVWPDIYPVEVTNGS